LAHFQIRDLFAYGMPDASAGEPVPENRIIVERGFARTRV
jgi:hypothetical protein